MRRAKTIKLPPKKKVFFKDREISRALLAHRRVVSAEQPPLTEAQLATMEKLIDETVRLNGFEVDDEDRRATLEFLNRGVGLLGGLISMYRGGDISRAEFWRRSRFIPFSLANDRSNPAKKKELLAVLKGAIPPSYGRPRRWNDLHSDPHQFLDLNRFLRANFRIYGDPFLMRMAEALQPFSQKEKKPTNITVPRTDESISGLDISGFSEYPKTRPSLKEIRKSREAAYNDALDAAKSGGQGQSLPKQKQQNHRPKKRDRTGYSQPGRAGKVPLAGWVEPELRDAFRQLAKNAGLTKEELMTYLVENALETAQKDSSLVDQIAKNVGRQKAITKRILRVASASLIKKATP